MDAITAAALERARRRLDGLALYPRPVRLDRVRVIVSERLFRLPWLRRFDGYALHGTILLRRPPGPGPGTSSDNLVVHELCHVWQMQQRPLRMPLSYLRTGYRANPYEREARWAAAQPAPAAPPTGPGPGTGTLDPQGP